MADYTQLSNLFNSQQRLLAYNTNSSKRTDKKYSKEQMAYFDTALEMWKERCDASTAKTLEFVTEATEISFDYNMGVKSTELSRHRISEMMNDMVSDIIQKEADRVHENMRKNAEIMLNRRKEK